ncbi:MAG: hypothetical protein LBU04_07080 [Christensenellaceae bacterium]|jgi:archaellum component FlaC|nr:hypothetical protein [Christensenellaceae bacterium]
MTQVNFIPPDIEMQDGTNPYANDVYNTWSGIVSDPNRIRGYIKSLIDSLNAVIEQINDNDTFYTEQINSITNVIATIQTSLNGILENLGSLESRVDTIEATLTPLVELAEQLQIELTALQASVNSMSETIEEIENNIDTLTTEINNIQGLISQMLAAVEEAQQRSVMYGGNFETLDVLPSPTGVPNNAWVVVGTGDMTNAKKYMRSYSQMVEDESSDCLGKFDTLDEAPAPTDYRQFVIIGMNFYESEGMPVPDDTETAPEDVEDTDEEDRVVFIWSTESQPIFAIVSKVENIPPLAPLPNTLWQLDYEYKADNISDLPNTATRGDTAKVKTKNYIYMRGMWQETDNTLYPKFYVYNDNLYKRIYRPFDTLASLTNDGFMSKEDFSSFTQALQDIQTLKEQGNFIGQEFATKADLDNFVTSHQTDKDISSGDFTYVEQDETHDNIIARYIFTRVDASTLTVAFAYAISDPIATNTSLGLIKGSVDNLKASINTDGTVSINGLSDLADNVSNLEETVAQLESGISAAVADRLKISIGVLKVYFNDDGTTTIMTGAYENLDGQISVVYNYLTDKNQNHRDVVSYTFNTPTDIFTFNISKATTDLIGKIIFVDVIALAIVNDKTQISNNISTFVGNLSQYATTTDLNTQVSTINTNIDNLSEEIEDKEDSSNKTTTLSSSSTDTQYPSAKVVYNAIQQASSTIPSGGLKVPVELATESQLPAITQDKSTIGNYYVIQNMNQTAPNHSGKAWINYTNPSDTSSQLKYYKMYDNFFDPDSSTIILNDNNKLSINSYYMQSQINEAITLQLDPQSGSIQPRLSAGDNIEFNSARTQIGAYSYSCNAGYVYQIPQGSYITFNSGGGSAWVGQKNIILPMVGNNQPAQAGFRVTAVGTIIFGTSELDINNEIYPVDIYAVTQNYSIGNNSYKIFARKPDDLSLYVGNGNYNYTTDIILGARINETNLFVQSYTKFHFLSFGTTGSNWQTAYDRFEYPARVMNASYSLQLLSGKSNTSTSPFFTEIQPI